MKIWSKIVGMIYILCGLVLSFFFLSIWANEKILETTVSLLRENTFAVGITGMVIVILGIFWLVNWIDFFYRTKAVAFDNPGGKIKVSLKAVEDYITSMITSQVAGIKSLKVRTSISSKGLETIINIKLFAGSNIPEICSNIQEVTKSYLQDAVGIERISNIEVFVTKIIGNGKGKNVLEENQAFQEEEDEEEIV
jgi:uncharacterized alkaline shock family protein YloU